MQRCREPVDDLGPQDILVLTDAPLHSVRDCPYRIDFNTEMRLILASASETRLVNSVDGLGVGEALAGVRLQLLDQARAREARHFQVAHG
jgi:hypothetical protein